MLLAIDTSAGTSVAVLDGDAVRAEHVSSDPMRHAEVVGALIRACLSEAGISAAEIEFVACGIGPGPFTGLRVGIAAAHAFALGATARLIPVVSHDALAGEYLTRHPGSSGVRIVTDARRREVYWSEYSGLDAHGMPVRAAGPAIAQPEALAEDNRYNATEVSAGWIGRIAALTLECGYDPPADEALYLRSPDVTLSHGPKRVSQ